MKKKHLLSLILTFPLLLMLFNIVTIPAQAQPPSLIGDPAYKQRESFDSNPTIGGTSGTGQIYPIGATIANVYDGDLKTNIEWAYDYSTRGFVNVTGFKKPSDNGLVDFNIAFIDIKIHFRARSVATSNDEYRTVFYLGNDTVELITWTSGTDAIFPQGPANNATTRPFTRVAKPGGGNWTWTDMANVKIGFENRVVGGRNFQHILLHEIWITAYSTPYPETGTVSVQPSVISGLAVGNPFYVDIYVTNVTRMWDYEILLRFNPIVLTGTAWHNYDPFTTALPSEIGPDQVFLRYKTYTDDPIGFTGNTPICRIYFQVKVANDSLLHFESTYFEDVQGHPFTLTAVDGYYQTIEGDSEAPAIQTVSQSASSPNYDEDVTVTANVTDNVQVGNVTLSYALASEWRNTTMTLVGGLYEAVIPAQPYNTTMEYRIYATDTSENWAASDTFTYSVTDDVAPLVSSVRIPNQPRDNQTVTITLNATEPANASGIHSAWFTYRVNGGSESSINMTYSQLSSLWEGDLPGQPAHAVIEYYCVARDNVGNVNGTAINSFTVALAGDANLDHLVNVVDAAAISAHWHPGPPAGPLGYDLSYDLNGDGVIGIVDGAMVSADWNKTW